MIVPSEVIENVRDYLNEEDLGELVSVSRASEHQDDNYLYHVIAKKGNSFRCWTCWNNSTKCLNNGHYGLSSVIEAEEILSKYFATLY